MKAMFPALRKEHKHVLLALVALLALPYLWYSYRDIAPQFLEGSYQLDDGTKEAFLLPLRLRSTSETLTLSLPFNLQETFPTKYHLIYAGKIEEIAINGQPYASNLSKLPSNDEMGYVFDFGRNLHPGQNTLHLLIRQTSTLPIFLHGIDIQPSRMDPLIFSRFFVSLVVLVFFVLLFLFALNLKERNLWLSLIFLLGGTLRILYVSTTRYPIRAYDWWGHIEFIELLTRHSELPSASAGWMTYHPPLFYALSATMLRTAEAFGIPFQTFLPSLEILSLLLSIAILAMGIACMTMLFQKREELPMLLLSCAFLASFPSLIFPSSNISNDLLLALLSFLALALLIRFFQKERQCDLVCLSILLGFALLTKGNAAVLVILSYLVLLFHPRMRPWEKLTYIVRSLLIIVPLASWFFVQRIFVEGGAIVGNAWKLHPMLQLHPTFQTFFTFNPFRILLHPFVNDWYDVFGREFFFEYLFRSALFGRFHFGESLVPFAQLLLLSALLLLIPMLRGIFEDIRRESSAFPLWIPLAVLLSAHILFTLSFPFSPSQDFRYSLPLVIPVASYSARGIFLLQSTLREVPLAMALLFVILCSSFPFLLYLSS